MQFKRTYINRHIQLPLSRFLSQVQTGTSSHTHTNTNYHHLLPPLDPLQVQGEWGFTAITWPFSLCLFFWPLHQRLLPFEAWDFLPKQRVRMSHQQGNHESLQREKLPLLLKDLMCRRSTLQPRAPPPLRCSTPTEWASGVSEEVPIRFTTNAKVTWSSD
jgi:hypothetical protein